MADSEPDTSKASVVSEPFPIFKLAHRFLLYDVNVVTYIREKYNICGVLIGGLPQAPQQNVFLGIPLELMPEEARLLVEKGVAVVQDDVKAHRNGFLEGGLSAEETRAYQAALRKQGQAAAAQASKRTDDRKKAALDRLAASGDWNDIPEDMLAPTSRTGSRSSSRVPRRRNRDEPKPNGAAEDNSESLFGGPPRSTSGSGPAAMPPPPPPPPAAPEPMVPTPATSHPPLRPPMGPSRSGSATPNRSDGDDLIPDAMASYPLFKHMHSEGYFMSPGLRFGCQYMAYPGDPLRFHSHFLCNGLAWDQEFDLLEIVGGGRLGTGVKKGFLIGGESKSPNGAKEDQDTQVRTFCIEWGGM